MRVDDGGSSDFLIQYAHDQMFAAISIRGIIIMIELDIRTGAYHDDKNIRGPERVQSITTLFHS
jgi:hypothetical protein